MADVNPDAGIDPGYGLWFLVILIWLCIALYNVVELNVSALMTFRRYRGLYFWSFEAATWGIASNAVGFLLRHVAPAVPPTAYATLILVGWCAMVTGQSLVLYSRLHLVMESPRRLRMVLVMIIVNATWLHVSGIVLVYGVTSGNPGPFRATYGVFEKLQLSVFCLQELIISGLYVWETAKLLRLEKSIGNSTSARRVMTHLVYVNILVIVLDLSILGLEFANFFNLQTAWKPLVYSIKLKLEFGILNRLVELTNRAREGSVFAMMGTASTRTEASGRSACGNRISSLDSRATTAVISEDDLESGLEMEVPRRATV